MSKFIFKAVILAGGSGERFWPLSTPEKPKQFLKIFGNKSLIDATVERLEGFAKEIFVITSKKLIKTTKRELPQIPQKNIIGEPMRRDTGAAVALGVGLAEDKSDPVIGFFPSDQLIAKPMGFKKILKSAIAKAAKGNKIVTIGIKPTYAATGFGYIDPKNGRFVEKPDIKTAKTYIRRGYLWNAGMFVARASVFERAFEECAPELKGITLKDYPKLRRISFDFAVMEKFGCDVVEGDFGWDDVGSYSAFDRYFPKDSVGNVSIGEVRTVDSEGNIAVAKGAKITLFGVKDLVVVTTPKEVFVVDKAHLGEMKRLF